MSDLHLGVVPGPPPAPAQQLSRAKVKALNLPKPPDQFSWFNYRNGLWTPEGNTKCGDCVVAGIVHQVQMWTGLVQGKAYIAAEEEAIAAYVKITCGYGACYDPKTGKNDTGITVDDGLMYLKTTGFGGNKLISDVYVDPWNANHLQLGIWFFGGILLVLALPKTAADQYYKEHYWDVVSTTGDGAPGSWGLHLVPLFAWGKMSYACITWGDRIGMSKGFLRTYAREAWLCLSTSWLTPNGKTPRGDSLATLQTIMAAVKDPGPA